jgi:glycosyltransferase involved in cell wall biosynthesis
MGISGGDVHFLKMASAAAKNGYAVNFWGGHALEQVIRHYQIPGTITLTNKAEVREPNQKSFNGQTAMFRQFYKSYKCSLSLLDAIAPEDIVYAVNDYWCNTIPAIRSAARRKILIYHMAAPSMSQIIWRSRPDVDFKRLASLHYHLSQEWSLSSFCACHNKRLLYVHPNMKQWLLAKGFHEKELSYVGTGFDATASEKSGQQPIKYDVAWIGRVHRQKGIADLISTLSRLSLALPNFQAVLVGPVENQLRPLIQIARLENHVQFTGPIFSEEEKYQLLKSCRLFLMPSNYESWGMVIAEAIISRLRVIAYELDAYRPIFGDLIRYVPCFDSERFQIAALEELCHARAGNWQPDDEAISVFKETYRWENLSKHFLSALETMAAF